MPKAGVGGKKAGVLLDRDDPKACICLLNDHGSRGKERPNVPARSAIRLRHISLNAARARGYGGRSAPPPAASAATAAPTASPTANSAAWNIISPVVGLPVARAPAL